MHMHSWIETCLNLKESYKNACLGYGKTKDQTFPHYMYDPCLRHKPKQVI